MSRFKLLDRGSVLAGNVGTSASEDKLLSSRESHPGVIPDYPGISRFKTLGHAYRLFRGMTAAVRSGVLIRDIPELSETSETCDAPRWRSRCGRSRVLKPGISGMPTPGGRNDLRGRADTIVDQDFGSMDFPSNRVSGVDEVVLQGRCDRRAGTVHVIGAGRRHGQHLANAIDIRKQDTGRLEIRDLLLERDRRPPNGRTWRCASTTAV